MYLKKKSFSDKWPASITEHANLMVTSAKFVINIRRTRNFPARVMPFTFANRALGLHRWESKGHSYQPLGELSHRLDKLSDSDKKWLENWTHDHRLEIAFLAYEVYNMHFSYTEQNRRKKHLNKSYKNQAKGGEWRFPASAWRKLLTDFPSESFGQLKK